MKYFDMILCPKKDHVDLSYLIQSSGWCWRSMLQHHICFFATTKWGGLTHVIVVNPVHTNQPILVLVVCVTCNCFDATWVRSQWNLVAKLWEPKRTKVLGPIIGHSSDDDSCCHQFMLGDYKSNA